MADGGDYRLLVEQPYSGLYIPLLKESLTGSFIDVANLCIGRSICEWFVFQLSDRSKLTIIYR